MTTLLQDLQRAIQLEGSASYLIQFGTDKNLRDAALVLRKEYLSANQELINYLITDTCREYIRQTVLFFAQQDGLLSESLTKACNINISTQPWNITELPIISGKPDNKLFVQFLHQYDDVRGLPPLFPDSQLITALNPQGGYVFARLDPFMEEFVHYAVTLGGTALNVGSGFGIAERLALLLGAENIICNDIYQDQLELVQQLTPVEYSARLNLLQGAFPDELNIVNSSIRVFGIFRVLHFFMPEEIVRAFNTIYSWLEPGGVLTLCVNTMYMRNWHKFIPVYEQRVKEGQLWPGVAECAQFESGEYGGRLPAYMHLMDQEVLTRELTRAGFVIEKAANIDCHGFFPNTVSYNGREGVGVVARKIK